MPYIPLNHDTVHVRLYSDASFQKLEKKHSQIVFIICLADKKDDINMFHWHSFRAPRRPHSTEEHELMAVFVAFRSIDNTKMIIFNHLKRIVPVKAYIDCETRWSNLMNEKALCIPEIGYRCREFIERGKVTSICLIPGIVNPDDAMTKANPNSMLKTALSSNKCVIPSERVFMLQDSPYRPPKWIPNSKVPMVDDFLSPPRTKDQYQTSHIGNYSLNKGIIHQGQNQNCNEAPSPALRDHSTQAGN